MSAVDLYDRPTAVYRLYDREGTLLYVGITCDIKTRWMYHQRRAWWPLVHRKDVKWRDNRFQALQEEGRAIKTEDPVHNIAGQPAEGGKFGDGGGSIFVSGPILEKERAQQLLEAEGWQLKTFVIACLRALLYDRDALLARLDGYWPERRQPGRPKKQRD